jgi:hypothetical protein
MKLNLARRVSGGSFGVRLALDDARWAMGVKISKFSRSQGKGIPKLFGSAWDARSRADRVARERALSLAL